MVIFPHLSVWLEIHAPVHILQQTKIKNKMSSQIPNDIGLAQGTVLAAILFVIYINDINNVVKNTDVLMKLFADVTHVIRSYTSAQII